MQRVMDEQNLKQYDEQIKLYIAQEIEKALSSLGDNTPDIEEIPDEEREEL